MTSEERNRMKRLEQAVDVLSRQLMMLQLSQEEMRRSDGDSGIKQVRLNRDGTRPYHCNTHSGPSVAAMHDHADMPRTCGMGEFEAVLNGVHFRTRHNDYPLRMPTSNGEYLGTVAVPFPLVPPAVLGKGNVGEQIGEMREWFKAWKDGDFKSTRDYRQHFKPLLCYLEGWWSTDVTLREPFHSERHRVDADDLQDLQDKIRFTSYTGDKNADENLAFLPTMVLNVTAGIPILAQWTYRILCHPLHHDLRLRDLKPLDDLGNRLARKDTWDDYVMSRAARFSLNPFSDEKAYKWTLLDKIMKHVPGLNGYGSRLVDNTMGTLKRQGHNNSPLNTAYYHRWYKLSQPGAMGEKVAHTAFADRNLFVAETTQPHVAPMSMQHCTRRGREGPRTCHTYTRRVTYAVPLEIVFLTPLQGWNPYGLQYKGENHGTLGKTVTAGRRNGKLTHKGAYNGTNNKHFYRTPDSFFRSGKEVDSDPADTVKGVVGVLDPAGEVRSVVASGVRILLPEMEGLGGVLRTRFPIMPVFAEGSTVWKEVEAVREVVMNMHEHAMYFRQPPAGLSENNANTQADSASSKSSSKSAAAESLGLQQPISVLKLSTDKRKGSDTDSAGGNIVLENGSGLVLRQTLPNNTGHELALLVANNPEGKGTKQKKPKFEVPSHVTLVTSPSTRAYIPLHVHYVEVNRAQLYSLVKRGKRLTLRTTFDGGHSHLVALKFDKKSQYFVIHMCDGRVKCWDGHSSNLETIRSQCSPDFNEKLRQYG